MRTSYNNQARRNVQRCTLCRNHCPVSALRCEKGRRAFRNRRRRT